MKVISVELAVLVALAILLSYVNGESCSPRSDEISAPFENAECHVTSDFKLHCHVSVLNDDPAWTNNGLLLVDFGYDIVVPQRIKFPEYSAQRETVELDAETDLELDGKGVLVSLPQAITLKLFANDGRTAVQMIPTWVGMFTEALVPDTTDLDTRDVLLIGMRGAGKSTLANSLVHVHYRYRPRRFVTWRPVGEPGTQEVATLDIDNPTGKFARIHRFKLRVIDTPGIKEDATHDEMKNIITEYMSTYKPSAVVFVCPVGGKLQDNVQTLFDETAKSCSENNIPMVAVGTKVDAYDESYVADCVTPKKGLALMNKAALPHADGVNWLFMHTMKCEEATVRYPFSVEAYGFEASAYNVLTGITNAIARNTEKQTTETNQKEEL